MGSRICGDLASVCYLGISGYRVLSDRHSGIVLLSGIVIYSDTLPAAIPVERIRPTVAAPDGRSLYPYPVDHTGRDPR